MISAIVITGNEEKLIRGCLESIRWVDEIIVAANQEASPETIQIAREYTEKVFTFRVDNFVEWRNQATKKASGDWLLYIDPDERVLAPLKEEISEHILKDECAAFAISRRNVIFGKEVKYPAFWPDQVVRLIKRDHFKGWQGEIHEQPIIEEKLGYTASSFLHLTHRDLDQVVKKSLNWSSIDAKLRLDAHHPPISGWRLLRILITELYQQGINRRGFFAGTRGVIDSLLQTFSLIMSYIRLWEMQQRTSLDDTYKEIDEKLIQDNFKY